MGLDYFIKHPKASQAMERWLDADNVNSIQAQLVKQFPLARFDVKSQPVLYEVAGFLATLHTVPADEMERHLLAVITYLNHRLTRYRQEYDRVLKKMRRLSYDTYRGYRPKYRASNLPPEQFNCATVNLILEQLDSDYAYRNFREGYAYDRFMADVWMKTQIERFLNTTEDI